MKALLWLLAGLSLFYVPLEGATGPASSTPSTAPTTPSPLPPVSPPVTPFKRLPKKVLPSMPKPFDMPGVVGLQNDKWVGSDYLGYLTSSIGVYVEIVKSEQVLNVIDASMLEARVAEMFRKKDLTPESEVTEGPPLPFVQILLFIYPVGAGRFAIFGACRLFERITINRKNFKPEGFWQAITWESQKIMLADQDKLKEQIDSLVDSLAEEFIKRYREFNPVNRDQPSQAAPST
jgi:hypothetical protein